MPNYDLKKYDPGFICKAYDSWPELARQSYENENYQTIDFKEINHVAFAGMGGSGSIGDILSSIIEDPEVHTVVVKSQQLPKNVTKDTSVVATSFSGKTYETLAVLHEAKKRGCKIIGFSAGGEMKNYCDKNGIPCNQIQMRHSPRASLPAFLYGVLKTLGPQLKINQNDILNSLKILGSTQKMINSAILSEQNPAVKLATWISGTPIIYYPFGLRAAAIRFKNSIQENTKIHAISEEVMEVCHNGIMSWERDKDQKCVLIRGADDHPKTKERWEIIKQYFNENSISFYEMFSVKGDLLSKIMNLIYLLDYTSIYLAIKNRTDPSPVNSINYIREKMKKDYVY